MSKENVNSGSSRRHAPSLFGPIILIAVGLFFLLRNVGALPEMSWNWNAVLQLWPLWLIFIGVNVIVRQAPRPLGALLSGLVSFAAVGVFGYVLLFSEDSAVLTRLGISTQGVELKTEEVSFAPDDVSRASIELDFGFAGADVYALEDSRELIAGQVTYVDRLLFETGVQDGRATVTLRPQSSFGLQWPFGWINQDTRWDLGLNPRVATDLRVDVGAGSANLDLDDLNLSSFDFDGGAGSVDLRLPGGDYEVKYDASAGSSQIWIGDSGEQSVEIDGSAGSVQIYIPQGMEARVEVDDGAGSFSIDDRFTQVVGSDSDEGVWETAAYDDASDRVNVYVDVGAGSVRVREP